MGWARVLIFRCAQWPISSLVPKNSQKKEFLKAYITCLYVLLIRFAYTFLHAVYMHSKSARLSFRLDGWKNEIVCPSTLDVYGLSEL